MIPSKNEIQKNLLDKFLAEFSVSFPKETLGKLYAFADLVVETKEFGNLISPKDSEKILTRHIADSLIPYIYIVKNLKAGNVERDNIAGKFQLDSSNPSFVCKRDGLPSVRWADMGAGAGCPVFPMAIAMPEVQFYAVEPRNKRVQFMQFVKRELQLDNMTVVGKRFETSELHDLDFISCRALSTFENDWERAQDSLKRDGHFVTLKSYNNIVHLETDPAVHIYKYSLPGEEQEYAFVTRGNE